jgi:hypothetical protein
MRIKVKDWQRKQKGTRQENQRGLGILPYGNFIMLTVGRHGEFRPCVRTGAVLAKIERNDNVKIHFANRV